jgi:hypothetical protein
MTHFSVNGLFALRAIAFVGYCSEMAECRSKITVLAACHVFL